MPLVASELNGKTPRIAHTLSRCVHRPREIVDHRMLTATKPLESNSEGGGSPQRSPTDLQRGPTLWQTVECVLYTWHIEDAQQPSENKIKLWSINHLIMFLSL
jgi:hypothetical protein